MVDLEKGEEKLKKADSFLTTLTNLLKKHWLILLLLLLGYGVYSLFTMEDDSTEEMYYEEPSYQEQEDYYEEPIN
jgi:hypothetical protein